MNERTIIRNLKNHQAALFAASELYKYFQKNFKSLDFHFSVTQSRMLSSIEVSSNSDKVFNEETISFCLGYAVRVTEEYERLFGDMK